MPHDQTYRKAIIGLLIMATVTDLQLIAAISPEIAIGLHASTVHVSYSFVVYSIAAALAALLLIRFPTYWSGTKILPVVCFAYAALIVVSVSSQTLVLFLVARGLCGIAGGVISALSITELADTSSYERRGKSMNFLTFGYFAAPMLGVPVGVFLAGQFDWRIALSFLAIVFPAIGMMMRAIPSRDEQSPMTLRSAHLKQVSARSRRLGIISAFFVSGGAVGFITFLGSWLAELRQGDGLDAGFVYSLVNLAGLVGGLAGGFIADRFGKRKAALHASLHMGLCLFAVIATSGPTAVLLILLGSATSAALRVAPLQALLTEMVTRENVAGYIATRNISSQLGIAFSVVVCGRLYTAFGFEAVLVACGALTLAAWITIGGIVEPEASERIDGKRAIVGDVLFDQ